jgi:hypothetical protein
MLFNIERDEGNRIVGYLVPDAFSGSPSVRITDGQKDVAILRCQEERAALVAAGRHETGRCGFTIDDKIVPDLSQQEELELYDSDTNLLSYRRRPLVKVIQKRIFRLETGLVPLWRLDDSLDRRFQFFYKGIERHGGETATQLFLLNNSASLYLSGRLVFKAYDNYIDDSFACVAMLRNPYKELAERLLTLKLIRKFADKFSLLGERDLMVFAPAMEFAETLESDEKVLRRAFGSMPKAVIPNLANPLTRQLAARTSDEMPTKGAVAAAIGTLSSFAVVGLREGQDLFLAQFAELLGTGEGSLPATAEFGRTAEFADQLKLVPEVELLIEQDRQVYGAVKSAVEKALQE